ncbi:MAG: hypothetical protein K8R88_08780, partial [Armatimonadetes bacterium]|nr:hypothetical protein [Armatimonadota bacterium]
MLGVILVVGLSNAVWLIFEPSKVNLPPVAFTDESDRVEPTEDVVPPPETNSVFINFTGLALNPAGSCTDEWWTCEEEVVVASEPARNPAQPVAKAFQWAGSKGLQLDQGFANLPIPPEEPTGTEIENGNIGVLRIYGDSGPASPAPGHSYSPFVIRGIRALEESVNSITNHLSFRSRNRRSTASGIYRSTSTNTIVVHANGTNEPSTAEQSTTDFDDGSLAITNTRMTVQGDYTNRGWNVTINSVGTFNGNVYNVGTWVIDPSTNIISGNLDISGTRLLTNSVDQVGNNLIIQSTGLYSLLQTSAVYVGGVFSNQGAFNLLEGSAATNGNAFISGTSTSIVSGSGSVWSNANLTMGLAGSGGSSVTVSNGGSLFADTMAIGNAVNSSNNSFNVGGRGLVSLVSNDALTVGGAGGGFNAMTITNGTLLSGGTVFIGNGSSNNSITVRTDGIWDLQNNDINVGAGAASANLLNIAGGVVSNVGVLDVGGRAAGPNNQLTISSGTLSARSLMVTNLTQFGNTNSVFNFNGGTLITSNGANKVAAFIIAPFAPDARYSLNGNWFMYGGSNLVQSVSPGGADRIGPVVLGNGAGNLTMLIGAGAVFNTGSLTPFQIGNGGSGNTLIITNGGVMWSGSSPAGSPNFNGIGIGAHSNAVIVTGPNSFWGINAALTIGSGTAVSNSLTISSGGVMSNGVTGMGGTYSRVVLTDTGSVWNTGNTTMGGLFNSVLVSNGSLLRSAGLTVGAGNGDVSNSVTVTGPGSFWLDTGGFTVGKGGYANSLTISNGGGLLTPNITIGGASSFTGSNNWMTVTGSGSSVTNQGTLVLGGRAGGNGNTILISDGAFMSDSSVQFGGIAGTSNNAVIVTDSGTVWSNGTVTVGAFASTANNSLLISNGALVIGNGALLLGNAAASTSNSVTVVGTGSVLSNFGGVIAVGSLAGTNSFTARDATVYSSGLVLGAGTSANTISLSNTLWNFQGSGFTWGGGVSTNNRLLADSASMLTNVGGLSLGEGGLSVYLTNAGQMTVNNQTFGFQFASNNGYLGVGTNSTTGNISLTISNLTFTGSSGSSVGFNSSGNTLSILSNTYWNLQGNTLAIGAGTASNNLMIIDGGVVSNTFWSVGSGGSTTSNSLIIRNGGALTWNNPANSTAVGIGSGGGKSNSVLITTGGILSNASTITFGGSFNNMSVIGTGTVYSGGYFNLSGNDNQVLISGADAELRTGSDGVELGGNRNSLVISNGGLIVGTVALAGNLSRVTLTGPGSIVSGVVVLGFLAGTANDTFVVTDGAHVYGGITMGSQNSSNNRLVVSNGGWFISGNGSFIGRNVTGGSNVIQVTGAGSVFSNTTGGGIEFGNGPNTGNGLIVEAGGGFYNGGALLIGDDARSSNNFLIVDGGIISNSGPIVIGGAGVGGSFGFGPSSYNSMTVTNGTVFSSGLAFGSTIGGTGSYYNTGSILSNAVVNPLGGGLTVGTFLNTGNVVTIDSGTITNAGVVNIGGGSSFSNVLNIVNGGRLYSGNVNVGVASGASNNIYNVGGTGNAAFASNGLITVGGSGGGFNVMNVTNAILYSNGLTIGNGSSNNTVTVRSGVTWDMLGGALTFGNGTANTISVVSNGTSVVTNIGGITINDVNRNFFLTNATGLRTMILGTGGAFLIGNSNNFGGNTVTISNQTYTSSATSIIGNGSSTNSLVVLTNTIWNGGGTNILIGSGIATNNQLTILGGTVSNVGVLNVGGLSSGVGTLTLSRGSLLAVNQLMVTNNVAFGVTNSFFNFNGGTLTTSNALNQLASRIVVQSNFNFEIKGNWNMLGGTNLINVLYQNPGGVVGYIFYGGNALGTQTASNQIYISTGAIWNISSASLWVTGNSNAMIVANGGKLVNTNAATFFRIDGPNNSMQVIGSGSVVTTSASIWLGGIGSSILVSNGGSLLAGSIGVGSSVNGRSTLTVTGAGSVFSNGSVTVGSATDSNSVYILDGGVIVTSGTIIGGGGGQVVTGNTLVVSGQGSALTNIGGGNLIMGGTGNNIGGSVIVSNGGVIVNAGGTTIGAGGTISSNNSVVVTGTGSMLSNAATMIVGSSGSANSLTISAGGIVVNTAGIIGQASSSNFVLVTDFGSAWTNSGSLVLGQNANTTFNTLVVSNGATLFTASLTVGNGNNSTSNRAFLVGLGGQVISSNGLITVGSVGAGQNSLTISNASLLGGGLTIGSGSSNNTVSVMADTSWNMLNTALTVGNNTASGNLLVLTAGTMTNVGTVAIGNGALNSNNSLVLSNGAGFFSGAVTIGQSGASNNTFLAGSRGLMSTVSNGLITVGSTASGFNQMTATNVALQSSGLSLGVSSSNNLVRVLANTSWNMLGSGLTVGSGASTGNILSVTAGSLTNVGATVFSGIGNSLIITNGGSFYGGNVTVGVGVGSSNNLYKIDGGALGSIVSNGLITVGTNGANYNVLSITNATVVSSGNLTIGLSGTQGGSHTNSGFILAGATVNLLSNDVGVGRGVVNISVGASTGNTLTVNGGIITNGAQVVIGGSASANNTLILTNGGRLFSTGIATVGNTTGANSNAVFIAGNNSMWDLGGASLTNGAANSTGNVVMVSTGGMITNAGPVVIGVNQGVGNNLIITNGGRFFAGAVTIGLGNGSSNNLYKIDGGTVSNDLITIGMTGGGLNTMIATNANIQSAGLTIGNGSSNNTVTVLNGVNWNFLGGALTFGSGLGNSLTVVPTTSVLTNIGGVTMNDAGRSLFITNATGARNLILGTGGSFMIGNSNGFGGDSLTISNQTYTSTADSIIGNGSSNNFLTILANTIWNGGGSNLTIGSGLATGNVLTIFAGTVTNAGAVTVGTGPGALFNSLSITNGGQLYSQGASVIGNVGNSNTVTITGTNSRWDLGSNTLTVGSGLATGNVLSVSGGATAVAGGLFISATSGSVTNRVNVNGGTLIVTNNSGSAQLHIGSSDTTGGSGLLVLTNGLIQADVLTITNLTGGFSGFTFISGTTSVLQARINSQTPGGSNFVVGDGVNSATFIIRSNAVSTFNRGLVLTNNSVLKAIGTITTGTTGLVVKAGSVFSPGNSPGVLAVDNMTWDGGGTYLFEINNFTGSAGVNWDLLNVTNALTITATTGSPFIIKLDSLGTNVPNFNIDSDYSVLFTTFGTQNGYATNKFIVDTSSFSNAPSSSGLWSVIQSGNGLYLSYSSYTNGSDFVWGYSNGEWNVAGNWTNNAAPPAPGGATVRLQFGTNTLTQFTATNNTARSINALVLNSGGAVTDTLAGSSITFLGTNAVVVQQNVGSFIISNSIVLATNVLFRGGGLGQVTLASNITGSGQITKNGLWNLILQGSNSFAGPVLLDSSGGTLTMGNAYAIGTNSLVISNGTVLANFGGTYNVGNGWNNQTILITGVGSLWTNTVGFAIGTNSAINNTVILANGGRIGGDINLGNSLQSTGNGLVITNGGTVAGTINLGNFAGSTNNYFNVIGSGLAIVRTVNIGSAVGSSNNLMVITGGGSVSSLVVNVGGAAGATGNGLLITNGGQVLGSIVVGGAAGASNNFYTARDGTVVNGSITVGGTGAGFNRMTVSNVVMSSSGLLIGNGSSNNTVTVQENVNWNLLGGALKFGPGISNSLNVAQVTSTVLTNVGGIILGGANQLFALTNASGSSARNILLGNGGSIGVGDTAGWGANTLLVSNQTFRTAGPSQIGNGSSNNLFALYDDTLWDGGATNLTIGTNASVGNELIINDAVLTNFGVVTIGVISNGISILNGGRFYSGNLSVGNAGGASNNYYNVGDVGDLSVVSNGIVVVGGSGGGNNRMSVSNANLITSALTVGLGSSNNVVTVSSNVLWNMLGQALVVGTNASAGNILAMTDGTITNVSVLTLGALGSGNNSISLTNARFFSTTAIIGSATSNNVVSVLGSSVWQSLNFTIGSGSAVSNVLNVGAGGLVRVTNTLTVGSGVGSSSNLMVISGGGIVNSLFGIIGNNSSNNTVLVTGQGSVWSNYFLDLGGSGSAVLMVGSGANSSGNSLIVSNGGSVYAYHTSQRPNTAIGDTAGASNNTIIITGSGSSLSNLFDMYVGKLANSNTLTITDGGYAYAQQVYVGSANARLSNNTVSVIDPNSQLRVQGFLNIGSNLNAVGNSMLISNGGRVVVGLPSDPSFLGTVVIGGGSASSNNSLTIVGGMMSNGVTTVGTFGGGNNMLTLNNGTIAWLVNAQSKGLNIGTGSSNNIVNVLGDSYWNFGGGIITVGIAAGNATGNQFNVASTVGLTNIGGLNFYDSGESLFLSNRNLASSISGINLGSPGSGANLITLSNQLITVTTAASVIGNGSFSNSLTILASTIWSNSGQALTIGTGAATGNVLTINAGVLTNFGAIVVGGAGGVGNSLVITNGAALYSGALTIGSGVNASNNSLIILGSTSSNGAITVGTTSGGYNTMTVSNAVRMLSTGLIIGSGSSNNTVNVQDGVFWNFLGGALKFGAGTGNVLNLSQVASTVLTNVGGIILGGANQTFLLTNASGTLARNIILGNGGSISVGDTAGWGTNTLIISNQAFRTTGGNFVGNGSSNNSLTILANTLWDAGTAGLTIGTGAAASNTFFVNGGTVSNIAAGAVIIGTGNGAVNGGNSLIISNGGVFLGGTVTVGSGGSSNNLYQVGGLGAASVVSNGAITVGNTGSGYNSLIISNASLFNGGAVTVGTGSSNNLVTVSSNTTWNLQGNLINVGVGGFGTGNVLVVNGGVLTNVNGTGSAIGSGVGGSGLMNYGNSLTLSNGAKLYNIGNITVGSTGSSNNLFQVGGFGDASFATNATITVGFFASANALIVTNSLLLSGNTVTVGNGGSNNVANVLTNGTWNLLGQTISIGLGAAVSN